MLGFSSVLTRQVSAKAPAQSGVQTLPPNEDGSITHVIQYGETLVTIAEAYGITLQELYDRNRSISPSAPAYFAGQILVIRPAYTATPPMTQTYTPNPPTRTPLPTRTPRPTYTSTVFQTATPTRTPTPEPLLKIPTLDDLGSKRTMIAYTFIGVSILGLLGLLASVLLTRNH